MKKIIGIVLIAIGIVGGIYFGLWWAFIGGIVAIVDAIRAPGVDGFGMACGIVRIIFASGIGWGFAFLLVAPGYALLKSK